MNWQVWLTILIFCAALGYLAYRWWPRRRPPESPASACACCSGCKLNSPKSDGCP